LEIFLVSTLAVAIAEIGDKTQLLAIVLAARYRKPWPIIAGILVATIANHGLAALAGYWIADLLSGTLFRYGLGVAFIAMAIWALIPDKEDELGARQSPFGVFAATTVAFFLVEIGDKTQVATIALAAQFHSVVLVAAGTTLGMMIANVPAVFLGEAATKVAPLKVIRIVAAVIFALIGVWVIADAAGLFG